MKRHPILTLFCLFTAILLWMIPQAQAKGDEILPGDEKGDVELENYCAERGNGWWCDGESLVKCVDGNETSRTACAHGCHSSPSGVPDFCEDPFHITQVKSPTFNPNGYSNDCNSCGPTSLAMALRKNYYSGSNNLTDPKDEISHARSLLYGSGQCGNYSIKEVQGATHNIKYRLLDCNEWTTNVAANADRAMYLVGGFKKNVNLRSDMDYYLNNNAPIILWGRMNDAWANVFDPPGHWGYGGGVDHYIAVLGKENGLYIVNDPLYKYGRQLMTYTRLSEFIDYGFSGAVAIYLSRLDPDPCSLYDGNSQLCDAYGYGAQQDCGFYTCSGKCRARGTHNCYAGCDEYCSSAPCRCNEWNGNLTQCDDQHGPTQDCAYYLRSGECRPRGIHNCNAGILSGIPGNDCGWNGCNTKKLQYEEMH